MRKSFTHPHACRLQGGGSIPKSGVVDTTGWKNIQHAYQGITAKLKDPTGKTPTKLAAIDYWMARLAEDRNSIANGGGPLE
jgi:hypothetical protein